MWGVQVKLRDRLRTCAIPERLRGVFTMRHCTNPRLPLPLHVQTKCCHSPQGVHLLSPSFTDSVNGCKYENG